MSLEHNKATYVTSQWGVYRLQKSSVQHISYSIHRAIIFLVNYMY